MTETNSSEDNALAAEVHKMLRLQDASSMAGSMGRLVKGAAVCLGVVFALATLLWLLLALYSDGFNKWSLWFIILAAAVAGAIFWYDRKTRKGYFDEAMLSADADPAALEAGPPFEPGRALAIILWGPRMIVDGWRGFRGFRTLEQHVTFDRAAILVVDLSKSESGVDIKRLIRPAEDMGVFSLSVDLLDAFGLIGKATDGKSLWLNSTFRNKLRAFMPAR